MAMSTPIDSHAPQLTTHLMTAQHQIVRQLSMYLAGAETLRTVCQSLTQSADIIYAAILSIDQDTAASTLLVEYPAQLGQAVMAINQIGMAIGIEADAGARLF